MSDKRTAEHDSHCGGSAGGVQHDAAQKLLATVMSGSNPYASHWSGNVSGLAMPPNQVAISSHDAEQLVNRILSLD